MSEPTLDPHTDHLLDERVGAARTQLQEALGDLEAPPLRDAQAQRGSRRMLVAVAAVAVALAGGLTVLAVGQDSSVSTTNTPTPPPAEQPSAATESTTTTAATDITAPSPDPWTSTPAPTATTSATAMEAPAVPPPAEPVREDARLRLVGTTFTGTTVTEGGAPRPLVEGTDITVTFENNQHTGEDIARWNAGCNTSGGPVAISADRLDVGPDGGSTSAGCPQARYDQDDWLREFFHADPYWTLDNGVLTLTVDDTVITLAEEPQT